MMCNVVSTGLFGIYDI